MNIDNKWTYLVAVLILLAPMSWLMFGTDGTFSSSDPSEATKAQLVPCDKLERSGLARIERAQRERLIKGITGNRIAVEEALWEDLPDLGKSNFLNAARCSRMTEEVRVYGFRRERYLGRATAETIELEP